MNYKHGKKHSRIYSIWCGIVARCCNEKAPAFPNYGGRGITLCDRWGDFGRFYADMGDPPAGHSIERQDNDAGYSPDNCRWATRVEQARNKRNNRRVTVDGETAPVSVFAERYGLKIKTVCARLDKGWTAEDAVKIPLVTKRKGIPRGASVHAFGASHGVTFSEPQGAAA